MSDKFFEKYLKIIQDTTGLLPNEQVLEYNDRISSGSMVIDFATRGGFDRCGITGIGGPDGAGKSTLIKLAIAALQREKPDAKVLYIDTEGIQLDWFAAFGINMDNISFVPRKGIKDGKRWRMTGEFVHNLVKDMLLGPDMNDPDWKCPFDMIVLDSYQGLRWESQIRSDAGSANMKRNIYWTEFLNMAMDGCLIAEVPMLITTQSRANFNPMPNAPDLLPGGVRALHHNTTLYLWLDRSKKIYAGSEDSKHVVGMEMNLRTLHTKICPPITRRMFYLNTDMDRNIAELDYAGELYDVAPKLGLFTNAAGTPTFNKRSKYFQGQEIASNQDGIKRRLKDDHDFYQNVYKACLDEFARRQSEMKKGNFTVWSTATEESDEPQT